MEVLKLLPFLRFIKLPKSKSEVFRLLSISTLMIVVSTLIQSNPVDLLFILLIEAFLMVVIMLCSYILSMSFFVLFLGLISSVILVPLLIMFIGVTLMMLVVMLGFDTIAAETSAQYPLINYGYNLLNGNLLESISDIVKYFGSDFYWIVGGIILHHLIFDLFIYYTKKEKDQVKKEGNAIDMYFHFTFKALSQSSVMMIVTMIIAIPVSVIMNFFEAQLWLAYFLVILIRISLEIFTAEIGGSFGPNKKV